METSLTVANGHSVAKVPALGEETMHALVIYGDLSKLQPAQKVEYYRAFCSRVGLDPATQPFKLLKLNGKEILYCDRGGTAQLNKQHKVSHQITDRKKDEDIYAVTARAFTADGRQTESMGVVAISGLRGEGLANAMMKAETKAKRRSTLDLLGLGMLDESEIETIPGAQTQPAPVPNGAPAHTEAPALPAPTEASPEIQAGWKKLRASLNKSLIAAKTAAEMAAKRKAFEDYCKMAETIWQQRTYHNAEETFEMIFEVHNARVTRDAEYNSPEAVTRWIDAVGKADLKALSERVKEYDSQARLQNDACLTALHERAQSLGLSSIEDLMESREDSESRGPDFQG